MNMAKFVWLWGLIHNMFLIKMYDSCDDCRYSDFAYTSLQSNAINFCNHVNMIIRQIHDKYGKNIFDMNGKNLAYESGFNADIQSLMDYLNDLKIKDF